MIISNQHKKYISQKKPEKNQMQLQQAQIINLAVKIFQNVGIKRYIGNIEALMHENIYFEIYMVIFKYSMINLLKISQSNLTTGEKIQKIIDMISSIIELDLYHISGEAIAQGNRHHLTNWLQLLEALSTNSPQPGGGSAPDRDRQMYKQFEEDDYYTVQGVDGQFLFHAYTDQRKNQSQQDQNRSIGQRKKKKLQKNQQQLITKKDTDKYNQISPKQKQKKNEQLHSEQKSQSSRNSNVLKPISGSNRKSSVKTNGGKKQVTFKIDENPNHQQKYQQNWKNGHKGVNKKNCQDDKITGDTNTPQLNPHNQLCRTKQEKMMVTCYGYPVKKKPTEQEQLLEKKKQFINKMYRIQEEMEHKLINDENGKFQTWVYETNEQSLKDAMKIEDQYREKTQQINKKISEREKVVNSVVNGKTAVIGNMQQMFQKQRQKERILRRKMQEEDIKQAIELMDLNFAADVENMVMATMGQ